MTHRGPFRPLPFCDSVIINTGSPEQFKATFMDISLVHYGRGRWCYLCNEQIHPGTLNFTFSTC